MSEAVSPGAVILVVDDEAPQRNILSTVLGAAGYRVVTAADGHAALRALQDEPVDIVLTDLRMPELDGMGLLERMQRDHPGLPVIMLTAFGTVNQAMAAVRAGAFDFLTKPLNREALLIAVARAAEQRRLRRENVSLKAAVGQKFSFRELIGEHPALQAALATLAKVAPSSATLLIYGESGTGKEIAAKAVHFNSPRAAGPFLAINCAAIPEGLIESELFGHEKGAFTGASEKRRGLFEQAAGGTLFLDEIGEMPIALQPKLLRVLQERELRRVGGGEAVKVDVRIIAATHQPLDRLAASGKFRQDLYYRLNVVSVELPPLRIRQGDIPRLALHFLKKYGGARAFTLAPETLKILLNYSWPGNVRQLEAAIERATLLCDGDLLRPEDLPPEIIRPVSVNPDFGLAIPAEGLDLEALEKSLLLQAYERAGRNVTRAATLLGLTRRTMQYRLKKTLGVEAGTDEEAE